MPLRVPTEEEIKRIVDITFESLCESRKDVGELSIQAVMITGADESGALEIDLLMLATCPSKKVAVETLRREATAYLAGILAYEAWVTDDSDPEVRRLREQGVPVKDIPGVREEIVFVVETEDSQIVYASLIENDVPGPLVRMASGRSGGSFSGWLYQRKARANERVHDDEPADETDLSEFLETFFVNVWFEGFREAIGSRRVPTNTMVGVRLGDGPMRTVFSGVPSDPADDARRFDASGANLIAWIWVYPDHVRFSAAFPKQGILRKWRAAWDPRTLTIEPPVPAHPETWAPLPEN